MTNTVIAQTSFAFRGTGRDWAIQQMMMQESARNTYQVGSSLQYMIGAGTLGHLERPGGEYLQLSDLQSSFYVSAQGMGVYGQELAPLGSRFMPHATTDRLLKELLQVRGIYGDFALALHVVGPFTATLKRQIQVTGKRPTSSRDDRTTMTGQTAAGAESESLLDSWPVKQTRKFFSWIANQVTSGVSAAWNFVVPPAHASVMQPTYDTVGGTLPQRLSQWRAQVEKAAAKHGVSTALIYAVIDRETGGRNIVGDGGHGRGLMQIDDRSHGAFLASNQGGLDAESNVDYGTRLLANLIKHFKGDMRKALAAYNAGIGGVDRVVSRGLDPDEATTGKNYASDVLRRMARYQGTTYTPGQSVKDLTKLIPHGGHYDQSGKMHAGHRNHHGIDLAVKVGTPLTASIRGTLRFRDDGDSGFGLLAYVTGYDKYGKPVTAVVAHLDRKLTGSFRKLEGQIVEKGQVIAYSGTSGRVDPHTHFELIQGHKAPDLGLQHIDPLAAINRGAVGSPLAGRELEVDMPQSTGKAGREATVVIAVRQKQHVLEKTAEAETVHTHQPAKVTNREHNDPARKTTTSVLKAAHTEQGVKMVRVSAEADLPVDPAYGRGHGVHIDPAMVM